MALVALNFIGAEHDFDLWLMGDTQVFRNCETSPRCNPA
jgi:hypothetical protein